MEEKFSVWFNKFVAYLEDKHSMHFNATASEMRMVIRWNEADAATPEEAGEWWLAYEER